jgi:uncharacterized OB-fold protein
MVFNQRRLKMRCQKLLHILALVLILSLFVLALPSAPVKGASESIELQDSDEDEIDQAEIGDKVYVVGEDFEESDTEDYYVTVYFSADKADEGDEIDDEVENYEIVKSSEWVDEDGYFDTHFYVPDELTNGEDDEDVTGGDYYVYVTYEDEEEIVAMAELQIIAGEIELSPDDGPVGASVEITGTDFSGREDIVVEFDGDELDIEDGDTDTDSAGRFECTIIIPESTAGDHTITVTDDAGGSAEATFEVKPEITLSDSSASPGRSVTVNGTGFGDEVDVTVEFDGDEVAAGETDDYGSFEVSFMVPVKSAGTYTIKATDDDKNKYTVDFAVVAGITVSPTTGNVGDDFIVSGAGFRTNTAVTITFVSQQTTATADSAGEFTAAITVPAGKNGKQTVTASDGYSTVTADFEVESTAPPVPTTILPLAGDKAKSQAVFEWEEVTDPSLPVTYNLQIATDVNCTSIVLQKTGLTSPTYTLTEGEKLASTGEEAPYYWRVQAVDGAGNISNWSMPSSFTVGFSFGVIPNWALFTLVGIAALLIILVVYLVVLRARRV